MKKNKFKITLINKNNQPFDVDYTLNDTVLAEKWFHKIKHLHKVPIDPVESDQVDLSDLKDICEQFCAYAGMDIPGIDFDEITQKDLNALHKIYEDSHDRLSRLKDNSILYKFHHSIHKRENPKVLSDTIKICWGVKEGPLTQIMDCQPFYEKDIKKNNIYLPWAELGKTPHRYWHDQEPNNQDRFNELAKPHITFRAKFFIATKDTKPGTFDPKFVEWFSTYKQRWVEHHRINEWESIHEDSAPLLAYTDCTDNLQDCVFKKITLQ